jgi:hypothetical protein
MFVGANAGGAWPTLDDAHRQVSIDVSSESWLTALLPLHTYGSFSWDGLTVEGVGSTLEGVGRAAFFQNNLHSQINRMVQNSFGADNQLPIPLLARFNASKPLPAGNAGGLVKPFAERKDVWALANSDEVKAAQLTSWFQYYELRGLQ